MSVGEILATVVGVLFFGTIVVIVVWAVPGQLRRQWLRHKRYRELKTALRVPPRGTPYEDHTYGPHDSYRWSSCIQCGGPMTSHWFSLVEANEQRVRGGYLCSPECIDAYAANIEKA